MPLSINNAANTSISYLNWITVVNNLQSKIRRSPSLTIANHQATSTAVLESSSLLASGSQCLTCLAASLAQILSVVQRRRPSLFSERRHLLFHCLADLSVRVQVVGLAHRRPRITVLSCRSSGSLRFRLLLCTLRYFHPSRCTLHRSTTLPLF